MDPINAYSFQATLPFPIDQAEKEVRQALGAEGFGVISRIDIAVTIREKLGIGHPPHRILGACNPSIAYRALTGNPDVALALPCNVVLREENNATTVTALLPNVALRPFRGSEVREAAEEAQAALERVFDRLTALQETNVER